MEINKRVHLVPDSLDLLELPNAELYGMPQYLVLSLVCMIMPQVYRHVLDIVQQILVPTYLLSSQSRILVTQHLQNMKTCIPPRLPPTMACTFSIPR